LPFAQSKRFIPTHVGNAPVNSRATRMPTVHPHARGERLMKLWPRHFQRGSSPRTWGMRRFRRRAHRRRRFIPTHVGNARGHAKHHCRGAVHPHARGERAGTECLDGLEIGSSPRTWGTQ